MRWVGAFIARRPIFIFRKAARGSAKRPAAASPERSSLPPVPGWTQPESIPKPVEAGLNPLLLAVPGPLAPGRHRQATPCAPQVLAGVGPAWPALMGALALGQAEVAARDAQTCGRNDRSEPRHRRALCVVPVPPLAAPASQTGRSIIRGCGSAGGYAF